MFRLLFFAAAEAGAEGADDPERAFSNAPKIRMRLSWVGMISGVIRLTPGNH